jgi:hypothetical protein
MFVPFPQLGQLHRRRLFKFLLNCVSVSVFGDFTCRSVVEHELKPESVRVRIATTHFPRYPTFCPCRLLSYRRSLSYYRRRPLCSRRYHARPKNPSPPILLSSPIDRKRCNSKLRMEWKSSKGQTNSEGQFRVEQ